MKSLLFLNVYSSIFLLGLLGSNLFARQNQLNLVSDPEPNYITIEFECSTAIYNKIRSSDAKFDLDTKVIKINGIEAELKSINTRGNNSLKFQRKSFSISLKDEIKLGNKTVSKIAVNNLVMDRNYWRNRFSFLLMKEIGLFPLENQFGEVVINGESQGVYLIIQKPDDFTKAIDSPLLIRTGYNNSFEIDYSDGDSRELIKKFRSKEKLARKYQGQEAYDSLNSIINLDSYYKWIALNYFIMNGDYTDEVYFYYHPDEAKFDIIPWDYDDVFASKPHEGWQKRNMALEHKLLFSSESAFDNRIDEDRVLYASYLHVFHNILSNLTEEKIKAAFENIYKELYPLYNNDKTIAQSEYDQSGLTNLENLKNDMMSYFQFMINRRRSLLNEVNNELNSANK